MVHGVPNLALKQAREDVGLSQAEMAHKLNVPKNTYASWEYGRIPYPHNRIGLAQVLGISVAEVNRLLKGENGPATMQQFGDLTQVKEHISNSLFLRLTSVVDAGYYSDQCRCFALIIEEFASMNTSDLSYPITRRKAITDLATLPFFMAPLALANRTELLHSSHYNEFLKECGASLIACEELSSSSESKDLMLAFQCVSRLLVELEAIISNSSQYRLEAQELAAYCAILKTNLGWVRVGNTATIPLAESAVAHADASGNINLQLSARSKLAWAYSNEDQQILALDTANDATALLRRHKGLLPICIRGGTYSTLAAMQGKNEVDPERASQMAMEQGPDSQVRYGMEFTFFRFWEERGNVLRYTGDYENALKAYAKIIDPQTLQIVPKDGLTERWRLEALLSMAKASIALRDKRNALRYWVETIEGAKRIKNKTTYSKVRSSYDVMKFVFRGDEEVRDLRDHLVRKKADLD
jgi:transcriptional regulator with XRE-family HTH domain